MKILLTQAFLGRKEPPVLPLGLASLLSVLDDHETRVVDPNVCEHPWTDLTEAVHSFTPDVIGVSLRNLDTTQYGDLFSYYKHFPPFIRALRLLSPRAVLIVGGSGFSLAAREIMEELSEIDVGFPLEAEESLPEFLAHLGSPEKVKGILIRKDGAVHFTGERKLPEFKHLPMPAYDRFDMARYLPFSENYSIGIQTKRGCSLHCSYCTYPVLGGHEVRLKNPDSVAEEIEILQKRFHVPFLFFADSVFNLPREHAEAVCRELIQRKITVRWTAYQNEKYFDLPFARLAQEAGCSPFTFSPDAYSHDALKVLKKNVEPCDVWNSVKSIQQLPNAKAKYNLFIITPDQKWRSLLAALCFAVKTRILLGQRLERLRLGMIRICPHTDIHRKAIEKGLLDPTDSLLARNETELARLFYRTTGSKIMDKICLGILALMTRKRTGANKPFEMLEK